MKIAYDAQIFHEQAYGGVSRYVCELALRVDRMKDMEATIMAPMHINAYLDRLPAGLVTGFRLPKVTRLPLSLRAAGTALGDLMLRFARPDLIHETYYFPYRTGPGRARRVLTIYDMIHERLPSYFDPSDRTPQFKLMAAQRADHIICISERTRQDLVEIHRIDPAKTTVVQLGFGLFETGGATGAPPGVDGPFLLYVGSRGGYKNFSGLVEAYGASRRLSEEFLLVCFGGGAFTPAEQDTLDGFGLSGRVIQVGGGDPLLARLYASAAAFVYPSLYEGFGIPPLEAMAFGCPVICSDGGSIPEVVGDAGAYFKAGDPEQMREVIERVVWSGESRAALIARGRERLKLFSWDRCARETADLYRRLA